MTPIDELFPRYGGFPSPLGKQGLHICARRGTLVWRRVTGGGADFSLHRGPYVVHVERLRNAYVADCNKLSRTFRVMRDQQKAADASKARGDATRKRVLALYSSSESLGCGAASYIARRLEITATRVRQILKEYRESQHV